MNVYLLQDGGDDKCWVARTMGDAIQLAFEQWLREDPEPDDTREMFEGQIQSVTLLGELGNNPFGEETLDEYARRYYYEHNLRDTDRLEKTLGPGDGAEP